MANKNRFVMMWLKVFFVTVAVTMCALAPWPPRVENEYVATLHSLQFLFVAPGMLIVRIFKERVNVDFPFTILVCSYASIVDGFLVATITTAFVIRRNRLR
jgi:hypothetical protein